ncbi:MAG: EamA family transporter, partial [Micropepsaceae bacterium]
MRRRRRLGDVLSKSATQTALLTAVAMLAFAANSILCRRALGAGLIDAASFAALRTIAGALTLAVILS